MYNSFDDTMNHIEKVTIYIGKIIEGLIYRGAVHDRSKLSDPEKEIFDIYTPKLKDVTYGSDKYKEYLKEMKIALDHHYSQNRHHPEYFENGIKDMDLLDLIEMICDWYAASQRHAKGDIMKSIEMNQERFGYSDELKQILKNTIISLKG